MALCDKCLEKMKERAELAEKFISEGKMEELRVLYGNSIIGNNYDLDSPAPLLTPEIIERAFKALAHRACVNCKQDLTVEEYAKNEEERFDASMEQLLKQNTFMRQMFPAYDKMFPREK